MHELYTSTYTIRLVVASEVIFEFFEHKMFKQLCSMFPVIWLVSRHKITNIGKKSMTL